MAERTNERTSERRTSEGEEEADLPTKFLPARRHIAQVRDFLTAYLTSLEDGHCALSATLTDVRMVNQGRRDTSPPP